MSANISNNYTLDNLGNTSPISNNSDFPASTANAVFYRSYSRRKPDGYRETWLDVCDRTVTALAELGNLTDEETELILKYQRQLKSLPSGRWLWVGGTEWSKKPENFFGSYNCSGSNLNDWEAFGNLMNFAMQGCGTGAVIEEKYINKLPIICNHLNIEIIGDIGGTPKKDRVDVTILYRLKSQINTYLLVVGDSRQGWVKAYQYLLEIASYYSIQSAVTVAVDIRDVRPSGEKLNGFGGTANPVKLPELFLNVAKVLNGAVGRQLTSVECCLIIDHSAVAIVAGNIRRSAGIRQFSYDDLEASTIKDNLWQQTENGDWKIDPDRDALRMANHTRVFHQKPSLTECVQSVKKQFYSGEGAIQWAGEAVARANADLLDTPEKKQQFLFKYNRGVELAEGFLNVLNRRKFNEYLSFKELDNRINRYSLNPCGEIMSVNFLCNLSEVHLNQIDPYNFVEQAEVFKSAGISAAVLLNHKFTEERYQYSRDVDPIVAVSFTGLFDFFVKAFGADWLKWWEAGRPSQWMSVSMSRKSANNLFNIGSELFNINQKLNSHFNIDECSHDSDMFRMIERSYLTFWKESATNAVWDYCDRHDLKRPNRCTALQPAGSKSLLTGASSGWHVPKSQRYIRRITFAKNDAIALAMLDYGYTVVPSQSDKDDNGVLLNDPFDPRCTEWLVEIPFAVSWADLPGCDQINISKFNIESQYDFMMQVQKHYVSHNTSATLELREHEIETLGKLIYDSIQNDEGYISATVLSRFDSLETFPRLPFEPISKEIYDKLSAEVLSRRKGDNFLEILNGYDAGKEDKTEAFNMGAAACDSDKCLLPSQNFIG